ncbi:MAG: GspE/PulE family protein [Candidatus Taylorbacteria bacterium]|nr:GspE/PulE family protein [Candidatus Taylorbacteria bacterium]
MTIIDRQKIEGEVKKGATRSLIGIVNDIIENAHDSNASDIHINSKSESVKIRFRIDGVLQDVFDMPKEILPELIGRIKILSNLRIDEHQSSQDGRFRITAKDGDTVDVRVAISPSYYGESAVLRLLTDKAEMFNLENLGFSPENKKKIVSAIEKPFGMILATGPTGSGKTTTLYTILKILNKKETAIITIEDPIEYSVDNIKQIQVNPRTNLTFADGLRSILRQDPDVIMVGEIRDGETASLAVNTALTGHLLLSTLHTNDAATTLPRLLDMKVEPFLAASTVNIAIGQRLVRKICEKCKTSKKLTETEIKSLSDVVKLKISEDKKIYRGEGCDSCNQTGYNGRIGIHEVLVVDNDIREGMLRKDSADSIKKIAVRNGMKTMIEDGLEKVFKGITSLEEVLRVIRE